MKPDRELIEKLKDADDAALWATVRGIALEKGFRLPEATPPQKTMERRRGTLSGNGTLSLGEAARVIAQYRKEQSDRG
ncbi:MAG: hypothetical protein IK090_09015 [Clostridia bacterium]|nr:hypothetical protein [Clostridia bacterium]